MCVEYVGVCVGASVHLCHARVVHLPKGILKVMILVLVLHVDDEVYGFGGTIVRHVSMVATDVVVVVLIGYGDGFYLFVSRDLWYVV